MKKILAFLGLFVFLILPLSAKATTNVNFTCGECVDNGNSCLEKCSISLVGDETIVSNFKATLELSPGLELADSSNGNKTIEFADGWAWNSGIYGGTSFDFVANPAKTGTDIKVADFYIKVSKDAQKPCKISLKPQGFNNVEVEVTVEQTTVNTGASLPMLVLIGGIFVAGIIYCISKRSTKLYKI